MTPTLIPATPEALRATLCRVVPSFAHDREDPDHLEEDPDSFHRVMLEFTYSFGKSVNSLSVSQLRQLGELINGIVETNDNLENAVATCFLEHLHQIHGRKALWPYLSQKARAECHA